MFCLKAIAPLTIVKVIGQILSRDLYTMHVFKKRVFLGKGINY